MPSIRNIAQLSNDEKSSKQRLAQWQHILLFVALAFGLSWALYIPGFLLNAQAASPLGILFSTLFMWTPGLAAIIIVRFVEKKSVRRELKLRLKGVWKKTLWWSLLSIPAAFVLVLLTLISSALLGTYEFDLSNLSGFQATLSTSQGGSQLSHAQLWAELWRRIAITTPALFLIGYLGAFGEELAWHAWLYPRLQERIGVTAALASTTVIWALWHAPVILLGHNYPNNPELGIVMFIGSCAGLTIPIQLFMNWGGSVWAGASAHAAINAAGAVLLTVAPLNQVNHPYDPIAAGITGWSGWPVVLVLFVAGAAVLRRADRAKRPRTMGH